MDIGNETTLLHGPLMIPVTFFCIIRYFFSFFYTFTFFMDYVLIKMVFCARGEHIWGLTPRLQQTAVLVAGRSNSRLGSFGLPCVVAWRDVIHSLLFSV